MAAWALMYRSMDDARPARIRNEYLRGSFTLEEARELVGDQVNWWPALKAQREGKH